MTKGKLICLSLTTLIITSCGVSYSEKNDEKIKQKTIDGVKYRFANRAKYETIKFSFAKGFKLENTISFYGMEDKIEKVIGKDEFGKKIDLLNAESLHIDSISFSVNKSKDKIDLLYYLKLDDKPDLAKMSLEKDNDQWTLN